MWPCTYVQVIVVTMLRSLPMLLDLCILAMFHFALFGVITTNLFAGEFRYRCVHACVRVLGGVQAIRCAPLTAGKPDEEGWREGGQDTAGMQRVRNQARGGCLLQAAIASRGLIRCPSLPPPFCRAVVRA